MKKICIIIAAVAGMVCFAKDVVAAAHGTKDAHVASGTRPMTLPQYDGWISGAFWGGGYVQGVEICASDPARCYAYVDMAGIYRSDDKGMTWRMLHGAFPSGTTFDVRGVSVDPRDADCFVTLLAGRNGSTGSILRSTDGGASFKIVARSTADNGKARNTGFILVRNPTNPDELLAGDFRGIMKSIDNGATWKLEAAHKGSPTDLRYDIRDSRRVFMCQPHLTRFGTRGGPVRTDFEKGFFVSEDGGTTWTKAGDEAPQEIVQSRSRPEELWGIFNFETVKRSTDNGKTWVEMRKGLPDKPIEWHDLVCNVNIFAGIRAASNFIVVCNTFGGFYKWTDGCDEWSEVRIESAKPGNYFGAEYFERHKFKNCGNVIIDPRNENHWYATDYYNVMQTWDGGRNWLATSEGMSQVVMKGGFVLPGTSDVVVSMMDHSWHITKDGGLTFKEYPHPVGYEVFYFRIADADSNVMYASGPRGGSVVVTRDGGKNWKRCASKGLPPNAWSMRNVPGANFFIPVSTAIHPVKPNEVYVGVAPGASTKAYAETDKLGVYKSVDFGETWTRMSDGLPVPTGKGDKGFFENTNLCGFELEVSRKGTPVAMSMVYNLVCRFDAETGRWQEVRRDDSKPWGLKDLQLEPGGERLWLSACFDGLLYSDDDGKTWKKWNKFPGDSAGRIYFDRERKGRWTVSGAKDLWLTEDGGDTWKRFDLNLKLPGRGMNSLGILAGDRIIYTTPQSGVFSRSL